MKRSFYSELEGFRGVAVFLVLISHWLIIEYFPKFIFLELGFLGVNFFFVLSGFLITEILLINIYNNIKAIEIIKNFFARRILRIFPIYYLTIIFLAFFDVRDSMDILPWTLSYSFNIGENWFGIHERMFMHIWSLCVEEQFYLIWPFVLLLTKTKRYFKVVLMIIVVSVLFKLSTYLLDLTNFRGINHSNLIASMDALAVGGLIAYLKCYKPNIWLRYRNITPYIIPLLLVLFWGLSYYSHQLPILYNGTHRFISAMLGSVIISKAVANNNRYVSKICNLPAFKYLGKISYGIYLYHWIVSILLADFFRRIWSELDFESLGVFQILRYQMYAGSFIFFLLVTLSIATISYYLIEKPFLKLKRYF